MPFLSIMQSFSFFMCVPYTIPGGLNQTLLPARFIAGKHKYTGLHVTKDIGLGCLDAYALQLRQLSWAVFIWAENG